MRLTVNRLQKGNYLIKKCVLTLVSGLCDNHDNRKAIGPTEINLTEVNIMALSNIAGWNENTAGSACGASDKPAACGASEKPAACGAGDKPAETPAACGAADKPEEKPAACGSACGAGDK